MEMKAANTMEVRQQNASYILHDIECNPGIANAEIANGRGLSVPTISNIVNILKAGGMVITSGTGESSGGRRPLRLSLNPEYQGYIGVSVARHTVYLARTDFAGKIQEKQRHYIDFTGSREYWERIAGLIREMQEKADAPCRVGLAMPGFVDRGQDAVVGAYTLGAWQISLSDIREILKNEVTAGDSCRLAGLAQMFGKSDYGDSFFILLSRRISGLLIHGKEIFQMGKSSFDVGSMILDPSGKTSDYGIPGSFLELCSASRIIDTIKVRTGIDNMDDFFAERRKGRTEFVELWNVYLRNLAIALHNIYAIFGVELVIGGEMATYIEPFAEELNGFLRAITPGRPLDVKLQFSAYREYDDAYGAALEARGTHIEEQIPAILKNAAAKRSYTRERIYTDEH